MATLGLDYSYDWKNVNLDTVASLGYQFVMRYLCFSAINNAGNDTSKKRLFASEVGSITARKLLLGMNWEYQEGDQLRGKYGGEIDATEAVKQAKALGYPEGCAIYFSTDFDVTSSQQSTVDGYKVAAWRICRENGYLFGQYAGYYELKRSFDLNFIDVGWQALGWSYGNVESRAALRQIRNGLTVAGGNVDLNTMVGEAYLWKYC